MGKHKDGVIYTPPEVVEKMLDMAGYIPEKMPGFLELNFMDNSCGTGNILAAALERACTTMDKVTTNLGFTPYGKFCYYHDKLPKHFHGMEIDADACSECKKNLNKVVSEHLCQEVSWDWDIRCCDSLTADDNREYDFVVCNPPYIRTHDLPCNFTGYRFVDEGMKDMYLAFYEIGLRQMSKMGVMCYITPSSWFTSTAGRTLRKHLFDNRLIDSIYDYGHTQVFENATTYVEITVINAMNSRIGQEYVKYGSVERGDKELMIPYPAIELGGKFYFTEPENTLLLNSVYLYHNGKIRVKNGYATLADDVFILGDEPMVYQDSHIIPVRKASTYGTWFCIYPYDETGKLISEEVLKETAPHAYAHLLEHREKLESRSTDEPWYAFGRTQAINDTFKDKWAIKSIVKTVDDLTPTKVPAGYGVYGGLYALCEGPEQLECLKTEEFMNYVKSLKKYKSGGYYTFSSKDLENYLNYKNYGEKERKDNGV